MTGGLDLDGFPEFNVITCPVQKLHAFQCVSARE